ncbi:MAG: adenylate/guanylate cyclase domain-containing protein [Nitriliruptorales bacterium]
MTSPRTLTFLFSDLEASTSLWERFPAAMRAALERHDAILRRAVEDSEGRVVKTTGDGLMAVFPSASAGVKACLEAELRLQDEPWGETGPLRVRMGVHAGEADPRAGDFFGPVVNRAARIMSAAHGGQVLLSALTAELVGERLPPEAGLRDLGEHRLKDLLRPEHLFQLTHPRLPADFPPPATLSHRPNNLPTQTSEFLGREADLTAVGDLLAASEVRLVTLTGPGGIGKTRLALQAAAEQTERFEDGLYFVDLSPTRDPAAAFEAIVRVVGLSPASDERPLEALKRQLEKRHMLLLLDNFEQVMDAADGVAHLLRTCHRLEVLVTSREALRLRGEHLFPVPPLSLPPAGVTHMAAETVANYAAVRLFLERAREARPSFELTNDNAATVAEICARLDGLPLAIELAAARLKLFSPHELRDRLGSRLQVLRGGPRDLPARQQTLRSTIEWSYELLDPEERAIFRLLAVFSTPRIEDVEEVAVRLEALRDVDVVDLLASLVDKSLVRSLEGAGPRRLSLLGTIREYAAERLEEAREFSITARQAHADHFATFALSRRDRLYGAERGEALDELEAELGNLRTAWRHWVDARNLERLHELLDVLWVLHDARGWYSAVVELARDLLGVLSAVPSTPDRVERKITLATSLARGLLALRGYTEEVDEAFRRALSLLDEAGGLPQLIPVLRSLASYHLYRAEMDKAAAVGRQLLDLAQQQHDVSLQVEGHLVLGHNLAGSGDVHAGLEHLEQAVALFDPQRHGPGPLRLGASPGVVAHTASAFYLWLVGHPVRGAARASRGLDLASQLNHPFTLAYALFHVGLLNLLWRELELVEKRASAALEIAEEHDYQVWTALALVLQGVAMISAGRLEEGLARMDRGFALYQDLKTPPVFWPFLLLIRARGLALADKPEEGLASIEQASETFGDRVHNVFYPELPLLKGDLLLTVSGAEAAEPWLRGAFDIAGEVGARMTQLRAATRLTRLWRAVERRPDGTDLLRDVYETFTEGFDTPDLVEARTVLDEA